MKHLFTFFRAPLIPLILLIPILTACPGPTTPEDAPLVQDGAVDAPTYFYDAPTCLDGQLAFYGGCWNPATECPFGSILCTPDGGPPTCIDIRYDPLNCGTCYNACSDNAACSDGICDCPTGEVTCGGSTCVNLTSDPRNCGMCGVSCHPYDGGNEGTCFQSRCQSCGDALIECDGLCFDPLTDPRHCGGCGYQCTPSQTCSQGDCV